MTIEIECVAPLRTAGADLVRWLVGLPAMRIGLVAAACALAWLVTVVAYGWTAFPPSLHLLKTLPALAIPFVVANGAP